MVLNKCSRDSLAPQVSLKAQAINKANKTTNHLIEEADKANSNKHLRHNSRVKITILSKILRKMTEHKLAVTQTQKINSINKTFKST